MGQNLYLTSLKNQRGLSLHHRDQGPRHLMRVGNVRLHRRNPPSNRHARWIPRGRPWPVAPQPLSAPESYPQTGESLPGLRIAFRAWTRRYGEGLSCSSTGPGVAIGGFRRLARTYRGNVRSWRKLQHPNIVPVYSFHQEGTTQAVCMPYRGPLTLAHLVAKLRTEDLQTFDGKALTTMIEECRRGREPSVTPTIIVPTTTPIGLAAAHPEVRTRRPRESDVRRAPGTQLHRRRADDRSPGRRRPAFRPR